MATAHRLVRNLYGDSASVGKPGLITNPQNVVLALAGETGTRVVAD